MTGTAKHLTLQQFTELFHSAFHQTCNVTLRGGAPEPVFLPAGDQRRHAEIHFVGDSLPSALHEVSHWLLAGPRRHHLVDYGYWYAADGRGSTEQVKFESVEVRPQALEWVLSSIVVREFVVSCDNIKL